MKQAVYSFIENVKQQYSADSDHRIAIVKFGSDATDVSGWTFVNDTGAASLKNGVERMQIVTNTGTQTQTGMRRANELINTQYSYSGTNTDRQKVVILFTDGIPGNYDFDPTVANSAVSYAKQIKDAGATVYAIGIFNGANVNEMYGKSGSFHDSSDGTVGSHWCASRARNGDLFVRSKAVSAVAGNRFLNLLSSNFKDATSAGLVGNEHIGGLTDWRTYYGWQISRNFTRSASNYYLTANNASSLDNIFQTISSNINTPTIDLGSETVVRDIVADCFEIPDNATEINVYTAAATADALNYPDAEASWLTRTPDPAISATVSQDGKTVSVSGFNYTDNFVAATGRGENSDFFGKKLILEFKVQPKAGFLGGNNVETNAGAGVYENDSAETPIKSFEKPTVNVPIQPVSVTAGDKNIYLLGSVTAEEIKAGAEISVGTGVRKVTLDLGMANDEEYPYGLDPWQMEYVTITVEIKDKDDKDVSVDGLDSLTDDNSYTVTVTVKPEAASAESKGTPATEQTNNATGKINVFKPELTFKDSTAYYGDTAPNFDENPPKTEWKHDGTKSTDLGVTMIGDEPQLDLTYTLEDGKIVDGKINTKQDIPVKADVAIVREGSNVNVNDHTTFVHDTCTVAGCGWNEPETKRDPAFLIHIQTCTLTIIKEGGETGESYVFTIYKDDQPYSQVTVEGNTSQTICELPVGKYTIAEDTGWSWRYTADNGGSAVLSAQNSDGSIICKNTKTIDKWLNGFSSVVRNIFGKH